MKNKSIWGTLFLAIFCIAIVIGCKKNTSGEENLGLTEAKAKASTARQSSNCPINFTDNEIASIGTEHNRLLKLGLTNYLAGNTLFDAMNQAFDENGYPTLSQSTFDEIYHDYSPENVLNTISTTIDTLSNQVQKNILNEMVTLTKESGSYEALRTGIEELKVRAKDSLTCREEYSTLIALEICLNSAYMWMPVEMGGEGYLDYLSSQLGRKGINFSTARFWNSFAKVLCADVIGGFGGFLQGALPYFTSGGPYNSISNAVLAGRTIIGAATSSATTGTGIALGH